MLLSPSLCRVHPCPVYCERFGLRRRGCTARSPSLQAAHLVRRLKSYARDIHHEPGQEVVSGEVFEDVVEILAKRVISDTCTGTTERWIVGIAGPPGGGKSTLANTLCARVNDMMSKVAKDEHCESFATVAPMDGFHLTRNQLDAMANPVLAHGRRGAHWTFDAESFVNAIHEIREQAGKKDVYLPSFDHGVGDPVEDDVCISKECKAVFVEGNYLFLDVQPWYQLLGLFDEKWFASCPLEITVQRVLERHITTGKSEEDALRKVKSNDGPNAELVNLTARIANVIVDMQVPMREE